MSIFDVLVDELSIKLPRIRPQTYSGDSDRTKRRRINNNAKAVRGSKPLTSYFSNVQILKPDESRISVQVPAQNPQAYHSHQFDRDHLPGCLEKFISVRKALKNNKK